MKLIYIAGPYGAKGHNDVYQNIEAARDVALKYWRLGNAVICPHANSAFMEGSQLDEKIIMQGDIEMIKRCDAIVMMEGWKNSKGSLAELKVARKAGKEKILHIGLVDGQFNESIFWTQFISFREANGAPTKIEVDIAIARYFFEIVYGFQYHQLERDKFIRTGKSTFAGIPVRIKI